MNFSHACANPFHEPVHKAYHDSGILPAEITNYGQWINELLDRSIITEENFIDAVDQIRQVHLRCRHVAHQPFLPPAVEYESKSLQKNYCDELDHIICSICPENIRELSDDSTRVSISLVTLPCPGNHVFHANCINHWFSIRFTCPVCRYPFLTKCSKFNDEVIIPEQTRLGLVQSNTVSQSSNISNDTSHTISHDDMMVE